MSNNNEPALQMSNHPPKLPENQPPSAQPNPAKLLGNYVLGKTIGKGTFGKVKIATHTITGQKVAIKILEKDRIVDVADVERVSRQIHILKLIRHPAIIQLYEIIQTPKHLFLIMEYVQNGQLFEYIVKNKKIAEDEACRFFQQILGGVEYLHQLNIVHRDLKPENLLIAYDKTLRLVDFGLSNTYRNQEKLKTACGSPCYAAPQMIEGKNKYDPLGVDIWSCGVILYAMLCGCLPFQDNDTTKLYQKILCGEYKVPKHLSEDAKDFLAKILNVNPENRLKIQEIRVHPFWRKSVIENAYTQGIIIGYHRIPVDPKILAEAELCGNNADFTKKCLQANRHNSETTTYYLLLKKHVKNGGISSACLGSKHFNPALIQQLRSPHHSSQVEEKMKNQEMQWPDIPGEHKKMPSFSFNSPKQKKSKTLEVRVRQTLYNNPRSKNTPTWSVNRSKQISNKPNTSISELIRQSPAITIKKYQQQYQTIDNTNHDMFRHSIKHYEGESDFNDKINRKYKELYGASLISKQKQPKASKHNRSDTNERHYPFIGHRKVQNSKKNSFKFNQTINAYKNGQYTESGDKNRKKKVYPLGEMGFDDDQMKNTNMKNFYQPVKMPYLRKVVFH